MSWELEKFDEDLDNPFDLLESLGWQTSEQEDNDDSNEDEDPEDDWCEFAYWVEREARWHTPFLYLFIQTITDRTPVSPKS